MGSLGYQSGYHRRGLAKRSLRLAAPQSGPAVATYRSLDHVHVTGYIRQAGERPAEPRNATPHDDVERNMTTDESSANDEAHSERESATARVFPSDPAQLGLAVRLGRTRWERQVAQEIAHELGAISPAEGPSIVAGFEGIARIAVELALALVSPNVAPIALSDSAATLVSMLVGDERENARRLARVDVGVQRLLGSPMKAGKLHLSRAYRNRNDASIVRESLHLADAELVRAHSHASAGLQASAVEIHLGVVSMLRGRPTESQHWLTTAGESAKDALAAAETAKAAAQRGLGLDDSGLNGLIRVTSMLSPPLMAASLGRDWTAAARLVKTTERLRITEAISTPTVEFCDAAVDAIRGSTNQ